jgi:hypothetical protein
MDQAYAHVPRRNTAGLLKEAGSIDLLFLIDATRSMKPYIDRSKEQVKGIVADVKREFLNQSEVRVAAIGYRDHSYARRDRIEFLDFTSSTNRVYSFLDHLKSHTAPKWNEFCEDVLGGVHQAVNASWKK